jgi:DNA-binding MarR family transcriptional regulator
LSTEVNLGEQSEALRLLRELVEASAQMSKSIARHSELNHSELETLQLLLKGPVGPSDIARHLDVTTAAASGIVDRLVDRGHADRLPHDQDRRRVQVHITETARAEVVEQLVPMFVGLMQADAALTEEERQVVVRFLRSAIAAVRRVG